MENCSVAQSNGLRLSIQLCSTYQVGGVFFPFFFFHSERGTYACTQRSLGISTATITP